ncbi:MAG TPA: iron-sulfur cluster assembly scaffold protein [bacterium]|nr:iron-sulfur cluster assembly scaffold protein [bacterium]
MSDILTNQQKWIYSDEVKEHFLHPQNFMEGEKPTWEYNGYGEIGSPACGDVMKIWILVEEDKIIKCGWKTFGCASAIASTSVLSEMVLRDGGMKIADAKMINAKMIINELHGLPDNKIHCSVLGDKALRMAIVDYENRRNHENG